MFKIIHISDMHYAARPKTANLIDFVNYKMAGGATSASIAACAAHGFGQKSHCPDIALAASQFLSKNLLDHHVLLVGGDVATTGSDNDQEAAFNFLKGSPLSAIPYRAADGSPTLGIRSKAAIMPGNHDRFQDGRCRSNGVTFEKYFSTEWGQPGTRVRKFTLQDKIGGQSLHLIAGDFCLRADNEAVPPGWPACCGQGTVAPDILREMCARTAALQSQNKNDGIIWLSHFPPTSKIIGFLPDMQLNGYLDLIAAAKEYGIKYILSGHIHENNNFNEQGVHVLTVGSTCSFMEPNGNWIRSVSFEVDAGDVALRSMQDFRWDQARKVFL